MIPIFASQTTPVESVVLFIELRRAFPG